MCIQAQTGLRRGEVLGGGAYLLRLVLRDVVQGAVGVQADPHHPHRELGRPLIGLQLGGCNDRVDQSEAEGGKQTAKKTRRWTFGQKRFRQQLLGPEWSGT